MSNYGSSTFARPPGIPTNNQYQYQYHSPDGTSKWKGPRRVCIFCALALVLPSLLISVPLLMRFAIYGSSSYIIHPSDMRVLDQRISTTWCQGESVRLNTSFSAYVTHGEPSMVKSSAKMEMDKSLRIPDDHKEYWGLYLLPGSTFKIKTCSRHKGGTLLIVRGHKHLKYCAYIGENDSTDNSDEVSSSKSMETSRLHQNEKPSLLEVSKENVADDLNIISKLKNYIQQHPENKNKIQKTLEGWMLLNTTTTPDTEMDNKTNVKESVPYNSSETETTAPATSSFSVELVDNKQNLIQHGTIRRRKRDAELRSDTESGENGAFEDESEDGSSLELLKSSIANLTKHSSQEEKEVKKSSWEEEHGHHSGVFNQSLGEKDGSGSESESSFSSSEEALLRCEGIIASYNIPYEDGCIEEGPFQHLQLKKSLPGQVSNTFQFRVEERDYYYFIFGSENEKKTNLIRYEFVLEKMAYYLPASLPNCTNVTECQISFSFASSEKVVIKLPQPSPTTNPNIFYVAETECKPRAHLYLIFVILVPLVILLFAFQ